MIILTKKRFCFEHPSDITLSFISKGGMAIEDAPDWITESALYPLALSDGDLVVVNGTDANAEAEAVAKARTTRRRTTKSEAE